MEVETKNCENKEDILFLEKEGNRPIALLQRLADRIREEYKEGNIHPQHLPLLEEGLTDF